MLSVVHGYARLALAIYSVLTGTSLPLLGVELRGHHFHDRDVALLLLGNAFSVGHAALGQRCDLACRVEASK